MRELDSSATNVALYARVSSDRQDIDLSISAQLRALRDYARKNGYLVVREFIDEAESGRIVDRPEFRKMIDAATATDAPFKEILVWKFSRFTRKREHAVAFKSMLRRKGVRVVSITEHADDTPTGKLMEAIIESVDEFYSENLAQEVFRGLRESASRGFWIAPFAPFGYRRVHVQDGPRKRPKLELDPPSDAVVRRIFNMVLRGRTVLDVTKALNNEGVPTVRGNEWRSTSVYAILQNVAYTGTLVWGTDAKDGGPAVRVENAFPAIISSREFEQVRALLKSRSPKRIHPMRISSRYLLSGLAKCESCGRALIGAKAKSGRYSYYVCQSLIKKGSGSCKTPRLSAIAFEKSIIDSLRENVLTQENIADLIKMLDEEADSAALEQRSLLETYERELEDLKRKLNRIWHVIETSDIEMADASERIREHRERKERLQNLAQEARDSMAERGTLLDRLDSIAAFAAEMADILQSSDPAETKLFIRSFVNEVRVRPGKATICYKLPTPEDSPIRPLQETGFASSTPVLDGRRMPQPKPIS